MYIYVHTHTFVILHPQDMPWWDVEKIKMLNELQMSSPYWWYYLSDQWEEVHQKLNGGGFFIAQTG